MKKFCNSFQKTWKKFHRNVKVRKTVETLGKKLKKCLNIFQKNGKGVSRK